jgi:hypothetical protein
MVKPVNPSNPTGGDGNEKYNPNPKRGPGFFDEVLEKAKTDRKSSGGGSGDGIPKVGPKKPLDMKAGGTVSKADMQKAGFYDKGRTKSERQKIVSKVTTKPQRIAIVEKAFSTKNMKSGGMASKRADGCAIKGKTKA